mmetsp:Transcript_96764/g.269033  ORF Transcript_96764/g.269033 Transcript_96764/m.269033 type:complete len:621 (+) Transcript_96764:21-1883(+)
MARAARGSIARLLLAAALGGRLAASATCSGLDRTCQSPWSLLQLRSAKTSPEGANQACRGATPGDNSEGYFELQLGVESLQVCKDLCTGTAVCKGIEYMEQAGRCEIWTRTEGIGATVPANGFTCLQLEQGFERASDESDGACRGADDSDNSAAHYTAHQDVESLDTCEAICIASATSCKGIEYAAEQKRCEMWTRPEGIGAVVPVSGFTCRRFHRGFRPVEAGPAKATAAPTTPGHAADSDASAVEDAITRGGTFVFSTDKAQEIRAVALTPMAALICSSTARRGSCGVVDLSGSPVKQGTKVALGEQGETTRLSVARLSDTAALACYVEHDLGAYGRPMPTPTCRVLSVSGTALTKGEKFVLDDEDEVILSLSLVGLSPALAVVCYDRLDNGGLLGVCSALTVSGTLLEKGREVHFGAGDLDFGPEIVAARLSEAGALVCYRDQEHHEQAACNALSVSGGTLVKGPTLVLTDGHFHSLSVVGLAEGSAVACYKDFGARPPRSVCSALVATAAGLARAQKAVVPTGRPSATRLSEAVALVCSSDTHHTHRASCAAVTFAGEELTVGPDLLLTTTNTGSFYLAVGLSAADALACYEDHGDANRHMGACTRLAVAAAPRSR